jgi:hypothetical protein
MKKTPAQSYELFTDVGSILKMKAALFTDFTGLC